MHTLTVRTRVGGLGGIVAKDAVEARVAKCHRYGRYICVKILEGLGKKCG